MEMLTRENFDRLTQFENGPCVTLLMPTHRTGRENKQDPIRFKNLIDTAEQALTWHGMRPPEARERLEPFQELLDDSLFWSHQSSGLAAFSSPEEATTLGVPQDLAECAIVDRRYFLVPMLPVLEGSATFFVLAISPRSVRLLESTRDQSTELDLAEGPDDLGDIARFIESEKQLQFHTGAAPQGAGDRAASFHGHAGGESDSERKERLLEYCRLVDGRLHPVLNGRSEPLVLACDKRLAPIYRKASSYPHLLETPIEGNPDLQPASDLRTKAWELIRPILARRREEEKARFEEALAHGRASQDLSAVLSAGDEGRVGSLLVAHDARRWGRFNRDARSAVVHANREPGDEELLNLATLSSLRAGASVHALPQEEMPGRQPLAAVMRY